MSLQLELGVLLVNAFFKDFNSELRKDRDSGLHYSPKDIFPSVQALELFNGLRTFFSVVLDREPLFQSGFFLVARSL